MTKFEQITFVESLCNNVRDQIIAKLNKAGEEVEAWAGHELRVLLAKHFNSSAAMSLIKREPRTKRAKDFRNTCLVHNL